MSTVISNPIQESLFERHPQYLIDSNCLITPNNSYYNPEFQFSLHFWDKLGCLIEKGTIGLLDKVYAETYLNRTDRLDIWLKQFESMTIPTESDNEIVSRYQEILQYVGSTSSGYQTKSMLDWTSRTIADPWLISTALKYNSSIITFEKMQDIREQPWKKLKIPTVAQHFGITSTDLFSFMKEIHTF